MSISTAPDAADTTHTLSKLVDEIGVGKSRTSFLVDDGLRLREDFERLHTESLDELLRVKTASRTRESMASLLSTVSDLGFSWSDVARVVGVSIPALRKWRHGGSATGDNLRRVAELVAMVDIVREKYMLSDAAGWLAVPLSQEAPITGMDLLFEGRYDLVLRYAGQSCDPEQILDEFQPDWRSAYASAFEVFLADDGLPAIRPTRADG